jgi:hypothetical protein
VARMPKRVYREVFTQHLNLITNHKLYVFENIGILHIPLKVVYTFEYLSKMKYKGAFYAPYIKYPHHKSVNRKMKDAKIFL